MTATESNVDKVAAAILYEGYILYPYRPSLKNTQRWTFGGIFPRAYAKRRADENCSIETQCLLEADPDATVSVRIRFLHLVDRAVAELTPPLADWPAAGEPAYRFVKSLCVDGQRYDCWQEAVEREVSLPDLKLTQLCHEEYDVPFEFHATRSVERIFSRDDCRFVGALIRDQRALTGSARIGCDLFNERLFKLCVCVTNETHIDDVEMQSRDAAAKSSFVSTHTILSSRGGQFISLIDPPERLRWAAATCTNRGAWPVLVGEPGQFNTMLAAPIILYDYPQVAAESPGDLFDSTEIDEILSLRVLTLTDEEKSRMSSVDERTRALLHRTSALGPDEMRAMHGTIRQLESVKGGP